MMSSLKGLLAQADHVPPAPEYPYGSFFFPTQASTFADEVDFLFYAMTAMSTFFFVLIMSLMIYFAIKYRKRPGYERALPSPDHNLRLEIIWTAIPSLILVWIFVQGTHGFFKQRIPIEGSEEIWVTASQFQWQFTYPDGDVTGNLDGLHLVLDQPVVFTMESRDVIHSFFVPAFRQKFDIVPGRYSRTWVMPTRPGTYRLYCAEYCGDLHSQMVTNVTVHLTEEDRKAATAWPWDERTDVENGQRLFAIHCAGCHSVRGETLTGPHLDGKWGLEEVMDDGATVLFDENYFRESLLIPNARVVRGFPRPSQMPSFQGVLNDDQIKWLIAYVRSLSGRPADAETEEAAATN